MWNPSAIWEMPGLLASVGPGASRTWEDIITGAIMLTLVLLCVLIVVGAVFAVSYGMYYLFSLPRRRMERAMIFLRLVDSGIRRGVTPEETIKSAAACEDSSTGVRFHLLAAWIERGSTWREAVGLVPRLLPPSITEMLLLADRAGGWQKIYPVCQRKLADVLSQLRSRQTCLSPSILLPPLPIMFITSLITVVVLPKFRAIARDFDAEIFSFWQWFGGLSSPIFLLLLAFASLPLLTLLLHVGGPRLAGFFARLPQPPGDWLDWLLPWQRKRLQRDFAALLGVLLDARVPEPEAVELAARGTANAIVKRRAGEVCRALAAGQPLVEALGRMDDRSELRWRFEQAAAGGTRFEDALAGWCDALQARADQLQQTAMHLFATCLLFCNALLVGLLAYDVFYVLIQITEKGLE